MASSKKQNKNTHIVKYQRIVSEENQKIFKLFHFTCNACAVEYMKV